MSKTYASIDVDCVRVQVRPHMDLPGNPLTPVFEVEFWRRVGTSRVGDYTLVLEGDHGFVVGGKYKLEIQGESL